MKALLQAFGRLVYWASWPFFWFYFRWGHGRTRILLRNQSGEMLVMKNWLSDGKWSMPGGGIHGGEPVVAAALRELREETGVVSTADKLRPLGQTRYRSHGLEFDVHFFALTYEGDIHIQRHEIADYAWVQPKTLSAANAGPDVLAALQMIQ